MKTRIKNVGKALVDRIAARIEARLSAGLDPRTTPAIKIGQLQLWHHYRAQIEAGAMPKLCETGFRCFSQFEEDGLSSSSWPLWAFWRASFSTSVLVTV
jgi:hypothetical protein